MTEGQLFMRALESKITLIMKSGELSASANKILSALYAIAIDQTNTIKKLKKNSKEQDRIIRRLETNLKDVQQYFSERS